MQLGRHHLYWKDFSLGDFPTLSFPALLFIGRNERHATIINPNLSGESINVLMSNDEGRIVIYTFCDYGRADNMAVFG